MFANKPTRLASNLYSVTKLSSLDCYLHSFDLLSGMAMKNANVSADVTDNNYRVNFKVILFNYSKDPLNITKVIV